MREGPRSGCPVNAAVEAMGDPWSLIVLRDVIFGNRRHFRDLLTQSEERIASNILASRLKSLVEGGLLSRDDAPRGYKIAYSLTESGIQTVPIMAALGTWGLRHRTTTPELRVRAELLQDGGPELWADLMDELRESHLGVPIPRASARRASERLQEAYDAAVADSATT